MSWTFPDHCPSFSRGRERRKASFTHFPGITKLWPLPDPAGGNAEMSRESLQRKSVVKDLSVTSATHARKKTHLSCSISEMPTKAKSEGCGGGRRHMGRK